MEKYRVSLSPEERTALEHLVSVGKAAARKLSHARILLLADTTPAGERSDDDIVAALGVGLCTIGRVRKRAVGQKLRQFPNKLRIDGCVIPKRAQDCKSDGVGICGGGG